MLVLICRDGDVNSTIKENEGKIRMYFTESIKMAIDENMDYVKVFSILNTEVEVGVERKDFINVLDKNLLYFESIENYEMCKEVVDLKNILSI
jgi:hypothetical protein